VIGVDRVEQPRNPGEVIVADVLEFLDSPKALEADAFHASPPCQRWVTGGQTRRDGEDRRDLIGPIRDRLEALGRPYVIENVEGSPLRRDVVLCGSMFSMPESDRAVMAEAGVDVSDMRTRPIKRHRVFELGGWSFGGLVPPCDHGKHRPLVGCYGNLHGQRGAWPGQLPDTLETRRAALGTPWMDAFGCAECIPPDYTELLGRSLFEVVIARPRSR
jgi:DNA (cytosine-5)-methyltransferase 1